MRLFRRRQVEATAREMRDEWLEWLRLSAFSPLTIKGYRLTSDKLLARWPDLSLAEFTDEHIVGMIDEVKPASRQARRSCFQNLFGWAYRTKRIPFNPMVHVPAVKQMPHGWSLYVSSRAGRDQNTCFRSGRDGRLPVAPRGLAGWFLFVDGGPGANRGRHSLGSQRCFLPWMMSKITPSNEIEALQRVLKSAHQDEGADVR